MGRPRIFYGWWIVAAGTAITMLQGVLFVYGFGAFFTPFQNTFGASRAQISGLISLARLEGGLLAPASGYLIDRFGPRLLMLVGLSMMGLGFILLSRVNSLVMLYVVFVGLMSVGASFGTSRPVQVALANWFIRRRSRVMGFLMTGFGLGASFIFVLTWFIDQFGWRTAAFGSGLLTLAVGLPLALVVRHKPEDMGLLPDGDSREALVEKAPSEGGSDATPATVAPSRQASRETDLTAKQALRTQAFWLLVVTYGVWAMFPTAVVVHQFPFLQQEVGLSFQMAGVVVSIYSFASIFGRIGFGWLGDYVNLRYLMAGLFLFQGLGMAILSLSTSLWHVALYVIILAPAYGGTIPLRPAIQGYFFGRRAFGTIGGLLIFADLPLSVAAPVLIGWIADLGNYRLGFQIIAALALVAAISVLAARRPQPAEVSQTAVTA